MPYIIVLNNIEGVEWIIKSLREQRHIVAHQLADGIEYHTIWQDDNGNLTKIGEMLKSPLVEDEIPKEKPKLRVVK